jgi:hypothetical protein
MQFRYDVAAAITFLLAGMGLGALLALIILVLNTSRLLHA